MVRQFRVGLQGTKATDLRHLTKSRVKRISKHMIQSASVLHQDSSVANRFEGLPTLSEKFMLFLKLDTEVHSVVDNHAHAYHLVNQVYHHQPVI